LLVALLALDALLEARFVVLFSMVLSPPVPLVFAEWRRIYTLGAGREVQAERRVFYVTQWFEERERALLGERFDVLYAAPAQRFRALTVNGLRCTPEKFVQEIDFPLEPSPFCAQSFLLPEDVQRPGRHPYHHAGVYYVQEPSAAMPATLLDVRPGHRVLDLCAAPGGKSSQLAAALQGEGVLVSNEYVAQRATVLKGNLERMGVTNAVVLNETPQRIANALPNWFDRVLVDAPCSGEGMFRKEAEAVRQHTPELVEQCALLGAQILDAAAQCLRPGGLLCYSTCTFAPQEDEAQVGAFLARHPDFVLLPIHAQAGSPGEAARCGEYAIEAAFTRRIYPCHGGEGHYMALLQRRGALCADDGDGAVRTKRRAKALPDACVDFLRAMFPALAQCAGEQRGETVYLNSDLLPQNAQKLHILRAGVQAGSLTKGRFVPAHDLAMAWGAQCANTERITRDDPRCAAWLRGEEIPAHTAAQGWAVVLVDGYPLGWGKCSAGRLKNHYPKGLRNLG
jgi:16S rRNA C967 or C1407 C5-methylase (RsmB/RsmF family)/NOL1/NOP2/fmu family ribosome biogenesis protein